MNERGSYDKVWGILAYLEKVCSPKSASKRQEKGKVYDEISMHNCTAIQAMNNLRAAFLHYVDAGANLKDSDLIIKALNILTVDSKYDNFRDKICLNDNLDNMRWSNFCDIFLSYVNTSL